MTDLWLSGVFFSSSKYTKIRFRPGLRPGPQGPSEQKPIKILEKRERGRIQGLPNFSGTPYYLRNGKSYGFQIWPVYSEGPSEQKSVKNFGEKGAWAYPGTAHFFGYPRLSHERVKLRNSNFARTFIGSIGAKVH